MMTTKNLYEIAKATKEADEKMFGTKTKNMTTQNVIEIKPSLDKQIDQIKNSIAVGYPQGIDTRLLAKLIAEKISPDMISSLKKLIALTIDQMAISVKVHYDANVKFFGLDFSPQGEVVALGLEDILDYKCTYRSTLKDSIVAKLVYNLVY